MRLDPSTINIADIEAVAKNEVNDAAIPADILAILDGKEPPSQGGCPPIAPTIKDISKAIAKSKSRRRKLSDFPAVVKEEDNPNILIKGRWLERGGSAFLVSTAGTGKSIWVTQLALSLVFGVPFSGLVPWRPLKCWMIQSEDSDSRVSIDRDDIVCGLKATWSETYPEIAWENSPNHVIFVDFTGYTGAAFLEQLRNELESARDENELPDIVIINPFMDFLGGDVTSNTDATSFLSGGVLSGKKTEGLRSILRSFNVATIIAHHTAKPPSDSELAAWIMSDMPEYKAGGASYITNWGRSFVTMMKVPKLEGVVMLTAGKNGGGLGWPYIEGARRLFLEHGEGDSCGGSGRAHYWRTIGFGAPRFGECCEAISSLIKGRKTNTNSKISEDTINKSAEYWGRAIYDRLTGVAMDEIVAEIASETGFGKTASRMVLATVKANKASYQLALSNDGNGHQIFLREDD